MKRLNKLMTQLRGKPISLTITKVKTMKDENTAITKKILFQYPKDQDNFAN